MPTNSMRKVYEMIRSWYNDIEKYITPGIDPNLLVKVLTVSIWETFKFSTLRQLLYDEGRRKRSL